MRDLTATYQSRSAAGGFSFRKRSSSVTRVLRDKPPAELKQSVRAHWNEEPSGTRGVPSGDRVAFFAALERERYKLEPYIRDFARFERGRGLRLLEVGVGAGTDFINWVRGGAVASGIDLTDEGVKLTRERLELEGLTADVRVGDAEELPFRDETFDVVYSYGVLHHTPDTARAAAEVHRVLKPGGTALVMIYHKDSWVSWLLWAVHCAGRLRPWKSPSWAVSRFLESPGTKTYSREAARQLFGRFTEVRVRTQLTNGDLLLMRPGSRYRGLLGRIAWTLYPRTLIRLTGNRFGMALLIKATK
jgi:ubiquinone/menaquinone biosynthesis C-methylase UbiE